MSRGLRSYLPRTTVCGGRTQNGSTVKLVIIKSICIDLYNDWESFELEPLATRRRARKTHRKSGCRNKLKLDVTDSVFLKYFSIHGTLAERLRTTEWYRCGNTVICMLTLAWSPAFLTLVLSLSTSPSLPSPSPADLRQHTHRETVLTITSRTVVLYVV